MGNNFKVFMDVICIVANVWPVIASRAEPLMSNFAQAFLR